MPGGPISRSNTGGSHSKNLGKRGCSRSGVVPLADFYPEMWTSSLWAKFSFMEELQVGVSSVTPASQCHSKE